MKNTKVFKKISIICVLVSLFLSGYGLFSGIEGFESEGFGAALLIPCVPVFLITLFDLFIVLDIVDKGFYFACINCIIKFLAIVLWVIFGIINFNSLDYKIFAIIIFLLIVITIPSIFSVAKLNKKEK